MFIGIFGVNPEGRKLFLNILVAFIPAAILGLLLDSIIENFSLAFYLLLTLHYFGAFLMLWAEKKKAKSNKFKYR